MSAFDKPIGDILGAMEARLTATMQSGEGGATPANVTAARDAVLAGQATLAKSSDVLAAQAAIIAGIPAPTAPATPEQLTQTRADLLAAVAAIPAGASAAQLTQTRADLLAAMAGSGATQGEVRRFVQGAVPAGWLAIADDPVLPGKAALYRLEPMGSSFNANVAYVNTGTGAGYWVFSSNIMQRRDLATAAAVGPAYICGVTRPANSMPFMATIGKYIYVGGGYVSSTGNACTDLNRFDTETGGVTTLAALPRAIATADAVVLNDGRILAWAYASSGLTQTMASTGFWLYDPATNLTAVEVLASLPLRNTYNYGRNLVKMPSGAILIIEGYDGADSATTHTTRYSCLLTVAGNVITASAAENSGFSSGGAAPHMLGTPTGAHLYMYASVSRTYVEGVGWGAGALAIPHATAFYTSGDNLGYSAVLPNNSGWVFCTNSGSQHTTYVLTTSANSPGAPLTYAKKL